MMAACSNIRLCLVRTTAVAGIVRAAALCALLGGSLAVSAHKPSDSYLTLTSVQKSVEVRWDIALRDLDAELGLDVDDDGTLTWGEVRNRKREIEAFVLPNLKLGTNRSDCAIDSSAAPASLAIDSHSDGAYAVFQYKLLCATVPRSLEIEYRLFAATDPTHRGIVRFAVPGSSAERVSVLDPNAAPRVFTFSEASRLDTLREFVVEGIWHIWTGFDHILFLLALLLTSVLVPVRNEGRIAAWEGAASLSIAALDMFKIVTAFTLAHSITLALAVLDVVSLPSRVVESVIAFTVILAALNNLKPLLHRRLWIATFFFGLVHGFGFASVLKDLGLPADSLGWSLLGFNAGVEVGQLAIVATFFPLAYALRNSTVYRRGILIAGSVAVAVVASAWFIERAFDLKLISA